MTLDDLWKLGNAEVQRMARRGFLVGHNQVTLRPNPSVAGKVIDLLYSEGHRIPLDRAILVYGAAFVRAAVNGPHFRVERNVIVPTVPDFDTVAFGIEKLPDAKALAWLRGEIKL